MKRGGGGEQGSCKETCFGGEKKLDIEAGKGGGVWGGGGVMRLKPFWEVGREVWFRAQSLLFETGFVGGFFSPDGGGGGFNHFRAGF